MLALVLLNLVAGLLAGILIDAVHTHPVAMAVDADFLLLAAHVEVDATVARGVYSFALSTILNANVEVCDTQEVHPLNHVDGRAVAGTFASNARVGHDRHDFWLCRNGRLL